MAKELIRTFLCYIGKQKNIRNKCIFDPKSFFDRHSSFEGRNRLGYRTRLKNTQLGYASYIANNSEISHTVVGKYSCIGPNVRTLIGRHPTNTHVSLHPSFFSKTPPVSLKYVNEQKFTESKILNSSEHMIKIGNDVWIGGNVSIVDGITINDGAIVAAGAVVVEDVPAYSIVGGVPAKIIKYRFSQSDIDFLLQIQWWDKSRSWIMEHIDYFNDIKQLRKKLE